MPSMKRARRPLARLTKRSASCASGADAKCCASPGAISRRARTLSRPCKPCPTWPTHAFARRAAAAQLHLLPVFGMPPRFAARAQSPLHRARHGQTRRPRAQLLLGHRSDVLVREPGETDGPRVIDNEEYFNRLGRELIRLLDAAQRRRLRVSRRYAAAALRRKRPLGREPGFARGLPAGARPRLGALCLDQGAARSSAPPAYAAAYEEFVRPFVYRRYLDFGVFESLRDMKALIEREVRASRSRSAPEARQGRNSGNRVHRAIHAAGARRQRSAPAEAALLAGAAAAGGTRSSSRPPISRS